ncbi:MAG: hypothetical protein J6C27_04595 [Clostridia bacterium]|nr:hypothetical protein [Clostridia bacterium]
MEKQKIEAVMQAASELNFQEWLKVSRAITKTFEEKEERNRSQLKLSGTDRIKYYFNIPGL